MAITSDWTLPAQSAVGGKLNPKAGDTHESLTLSWRHGQAVALGAAGAEPAVEDDQRAARYP